MIISTLELRSRKKSEQRISIVPLSLKPELAGCAVSWEGGWQGGLSPRVQALQGGKLASNYGMPFAPSCMAAGREDEVTSKEVGGGAWKQWLCFWHGQFGSLRNLVFPSSVVETVGDGLHLFSFGNVVARQLFYTR